MKKRSTNDHERTDAIEPAGVPPGKQGRTHTLQQKKRSAAQPEPPPIQAAHPPAADMTPRGDETFLESIIGTVQRKGDGDTQDGNIHDVAAAGTSGSSHALPHLDRIQASFGQHDVTGVKAHTDAAASSAAVSMGASAYATGDRVAFASAPDLHTAAHEAAHVVQQCAGVQLKGGVGQEGDAFERQADSVADAVVRGESAEVLLSQTAGHGATGESPAVQRQAAPAETPVTQGELKEVVAKMNLINAYSMQMDFVFDSMKAGVKDTCDRLEKRKSPKSDVMGRMVEIAASAAIAGVAGIVAEAAAKRLAAGLKRAVSDVGANIDEFAVYLQSSQRFMNDGFKEIIKKSLQHGLAVKADLAMDLLSLDFQRAQDRKIDEARNDFIVDFGTEASNRLINLPLDRLQQLVNENRGNVLDPEIRAMTARNTAVEWANLVAQLHHGDGSWDPWAGPLGSERARPTADNAGDPRYAKDKEHHPSDANVSPNSASVRDLVDDDQRKMNPDAHGILEIDLWGHHYQPDYGFSSFELFARSGFGMRLDGVSNHVKRMVAEHGRVGDIKMNKIVTIYSSRGNHLNPPKPDGRFLITADGYVRRWMISDSEYNMDAAANAAQDLSPSSIR